MIWKSTVVASIALALFWTGAAEVAGQGKMGGGKGCCKMGGGKMGGGKMGGGKMGGGKMGGGMMGSSMMGGDGTPTMEDPASQLQLYQTMLQLQATQGMLQQHLVAGVEAMADKSADDVRAALKSPRANTRFAAAYWIGEKGLPNVDELIPLVTDRSPLVRQAARRSLVMLSYRIDAAKKGKDSAAKVKAVDFGPTPAASVYGWSNSARQWKTWMDQNKKHLEPLATPLATPLAK